MRFWGGEKDDGAELVQRADEGVGEGGGGFNASVLGVESGGGLKLHVCGGLLALGVQGGEEGVALGVQEGADLQGLCSVGGGEVWLVAGSKALFHLAVGAAWVLRVDDQVFIAAAKFEEVQQSVRRSGLRRRGTGRGRRWWRVRGG